MPTLSSAEYVYGSVDSSDLGDATRTAVLLLPCLRCGAEGSHSRLLEVADGFAVLCRQCDPKIPADPREYVPDMLHQSLP